MPVTTDFNLGSYCIWAGFVANKPVFVGADGGALLENKEKLNLAEGVASAALTSDGNSLLAGGEDGRILRLGIDGTVQELARHGNKWLTSLACGPKNTFAVASGRMVFAYEGSVVQELPQQRSVEGLAFAPKGICLAVARYNGVDLYWPGTQKQSQQLEWKGAHRDVTFSPNGKFIITSMQENTLHGWRLADEQHLRMAGYPTKVKSWSWSAKGRYLATSGASVAVVWPFLDRDGPMGKPPLELGVRSNALVTCVCCHPKEEMVAIGYDDGMILFVRFVDRREVLLREPDGAPISVLNWDGAGLRLTFGGDAGACGLIDIGR